MPRLLITLHGTSPRVGGTWAVTGNFAVASGPANGPAFNSVLTTLRNTLAGGTAFAAGISSNYSLTGIHGLYYPVPGGTASVVGDSTGAAIPGTATAGPPPLAVCVSERTNAAGASYRGRSYWPYGVAGNDGSVGASGQAQVLASWQAWHTAAISALAGASYSPIHVVWSKKTGNMTPITYIQTGNRIDTARGRFGSAPEVYTTNVVSTSFSATPASLGDPDGTMDIPTLQDIANGNAWGSLELVPDGSKGPLKELIGDALSAITVEAIPPEAAVEEDDTEESTTDE